MILISRSRKILFYSVCLLWCVFITTPLRAEVLGPGWFSVTAEPVSPKEARAYYKQNAMSPIQVLGYKVGAGASEAMIKTLSATTLTPEITELARALQYDPKLIYDYVHNHIDYIPYFGSLKGATLTYLDGSGNDFDQASLMIALLRAGGYTASYEYGTMTIPGYKVANWVGTGLSTAVVYNVFAYGGIPIQIPNSSEALISRVWVKANISGAEYHFDPALKSYNYTSKVDIASAIGYSRSDLLNAVSNGATVSSDYVHKLNEKALSDKLVEYSSNLVNTIRNQYPNSTVDEIVGGRSVVETTLIGYSTSLPYKTVLEAGWDEIPPEYTAKLRVEHVGIDHSFYIPDIAGKRLTVTYAGGDFHPELRLDGELVATGTATTLGSKYDLILTIDHPYAASNGTYCDQTSTYDMESGATYALVSAFAGISDRLIQKRQRQLDSYKAQGLTETSEQVLGESLNIMGLTWTKETLMTSHLVANFSDFVTMLHHGIGRMSQESSYYIDFKTWIDTWIPKFNADTSAGHSRMAYYSVASALEHGILEQMMGSEYPGVSTVKLLQIANNNGKKVFCADSTNFALIRPQLKNYNPNLLDK